MVTVAGAVTAAHPPAAATVLVMMYVPGVEVDGVIAPVEAFSVRPVVEVNAPAVAPVANVAAAGAVALVQKLVAAYPKSAVAGAVMVTVAIPVTAAHPPLAATVLVMV